jgi:hypothetical protein
MKRLHSLFSYSILLLILPSLSIADTSNVLNKERILQIIEQSAQLKSSKKRNRSSVRKYISSIKKNKKSSSISDNSLINNLIEKKIGARFEKKTLSFKVLPSIHPSENAEDLKHRFIKCNQEEGVPTPIASPLLSRASVLELKKLEPITSAGPHKEYHDIIKKFY